MSKVLYKGRTGFFKFILLSMLFLWGSVFLFNAQAYANDEVAEAFAEVAGVRSSNQELARQVRATFKPTDKKYREASLKYGALKGAADAWIDQLRIDLVRGQQSTKSLEKLRENFSVNANDFSAYARSSLEGQSKSGVAVVAILASLVEIGIKLFDIWSQKNDEKQKEVLSELEGLRFISFEDL
ncbi:TPA: hypothetical protein SAN82_005415 [Pseudomonas putida]|nr:hypothetical protein [Pseudomonas putida]